LIKLDEPSSPNAMMYRTSEMARREWDAAEMTSDHFAWSMLMKWIDRK
jgi:hypothetical protein